MIHTHHDPNVPSMQESLIGGFSMFFAAIFIYTLCYAAWIWRKK